MLRSTTLWQLTLLGAFLCLLGLPHNPLNLWTIPIILSFFACPLATSLWISIGVGTLLDLLGSHQPMGLYAATSAATTVILYRSRIFFFEDSPTTIPVLTTLYSSLITLFLLLVTPFHHTLSGLTTDLILLPAADGLASFCLVTLPLLLFRTLRSRPGHGAIHRPK